MNLKMSVLFLILGGICLSFAGGEDIIFCVRPSQPSTTNCSSQECRHCDTLQYYFDNANTTINDQENVTLLFLDGTHTINTSLVILDAPVNMRMKGESVDISRASINCSLSGNFCTIILTHPTCINNIEMVRIWIWTGNVPYFIMTSVKLIQSDISIAYYTCTKATVNFESMVIKSSEIIVMNASSTIKLFFDNCSLSDTTLILSSVKNALVKDTSFLNSYLRVQTSNIVFSGITELIGTNDGYESLITSYSSSNITLSGTMLFANNSGIRGGALALHCSTLSIATGTNATFINNFAHEKGGAIYFEPGMSARDGLIYKLLSEMKNPGILNFRTLKFSCFYQLLDCSVNSTYKLNFVNNSAIYEGDDIYGISTQVSDLTCQTQPGYKCNLTLNGRSSDLSSVSSDPMRVCLCNQGKPQCRSYGYLSVYPGEIFTLSASLIGGNQGTTTGTVYASYYSLNLTLIKSISHSISDSSQCSELKDSFYTKLNNTSHENNYFMILTASFLPQEALSLYVNCLQNDSDGVFCSSYTPIFFYITLLKCPVGFSLIGDPPKCDCYPILTNNGVNCKAVKGNGYLSWNSTLWIDAEKDIITYAKYCPLNYCTIGNKQVDVNISLDSQCAFNRAGRLCGGCKEGYSLAIGSSHCIHCPNNNKLALLIFFAAAGFLLVLFISAFNLTVTKGMINGLIFYANIVWIYQSIFISLSDDSNPVLIFLKTFIAWVNLDFGIETCFAHGLTAFSKTWLQFVFPLYIWIIAGLIILATKYSSGMTKLFGNTAVPVLNTLFFLSYAKLLHVVASSMEFSNLQVYSSPSTHVDKLITVWSADGNLLYFGFPHILLFVAGLATLLFLWLPYTLFLFFWQWLRRLSDFRFLRWVLRFNPVYDAYFAPLKHKHTYWFGVLLVVRGFLLVTFTSTFGVSNTINLLILLIVGVVLLFYITLTQPYKSTAILFLQSSFLINLIILSGFDIFAYTQHRQQLLKNVAFGISAGIAFLQFCIIVVYSRVGSRCTCRRSKAVKENNNDCDNGKPMAGVTVDSHSVGLRDSIFEESQKLLTDDP